MSKAYELSSSRQFVRIAVNESHNLVAAADQFGHITIVDMCAKRSHLLTTKVDSCVTCVAFAFDAHNESEVNLIVASCNDNAVNCLSESINLNNY